MTDLATSLAYMRFLSSVDPRMNRQSRSLYELFSTSWPFTRMRADTAVYAFYNKN